MSAPPSPPNAELGQLYQHHHLWLQHWLRRRLSCPQRAADLMQDTFVRILASSEALELVRLLREPRNYLATVARRVMIDHFRRQQLERAYLEALAAQPEAEQISTEEQIVILQTLREIDQLLAGCGAKARKAFLMANWLGMTYVEIAAALGVSLTTVKKYLIKTTERCLLLAYDAQP
ncbi:sigma-70 family RNA polymerase sigma factor [Pseudomonas rubra]|uniref:Sigma-70 family RNA polymerase sigma factor n=1 Tax=Pseudomonas rubra TaxID=2942627 RepID=A0ABT5PA89_9PSED|nr:sigma-70 family RNA polymerase sigma factor [Pseudomonas rubra]MDD1015096.1 sigma-70 family RNA polymerase sigma factor [Pseudomonas rubra]MDD1038569.1 sigma-70 family RNA polymerase sigma factor [Pseudomonas rubra]MDD1154739.1 sigma-70 family RNA polymerase sigma factor [Pseudomonas rubra]